MSKQIITYRQEISTLFTEEVRILNNAREITNVSSELRLLAINGLLQASKIGTAQGQSLITLSGFLSDLPRNITPELDALESITIQLTRDLTESLLALIRILFYTDTLINFINQLLSNLHSSFQVDDFNLLNVKDLKKIPTNELFANNSGIILSNLAYLTHNNINKINQIHSKLQSSSMLLDKVQEKIESIKRNGVIANYMGTNILIESSYLDESRGNFESLVDNILKIINNLNEYLDAMNDSIIKAKNIIKNLNL
ncbi:MAG TPA: hypothetical protein PLC04_01830 [Candidatus Kapabacteria bacterium]|jgi:hypothetical protein|nr:hypothetical protein [Candidatus Kapabacteria bacterium]HOV91805.1 hypothetical protein [Candidatus Kapabacteria bacterium]